MKWSATDPATIRTKPKKPRCFRSEAISRASLIITWCKKKTISSLWVNKIFILSANATKSLLKNHSYQLITRPTKLSSTFVEKVSDTGPMKSISALSKLWTSMVRTGPRFSTMLAHALASLFILTPKSLESVSRRSQISLVQSWPQFSPSLTSNTMDSLLSCANERWALKTSYPSRNFRKTSKRKKTNETKVLYQRWQIIWAMAQKHDYLKWWFETKPPKFVSLSQLEKQ